MGEADDLTLLRERYEQALTAYEAVCSQLNRKLIAGMQPGSEDLQREREARATLDSTRRAYLDAWMLP